MRRLIFAFLVGLFFLPQVSAASELGRAIVNGQEIIIFDNKTWDYAPDTTAGSDGDCTVVKSEVLPISICLDPNEWGFIDAGAAPEHALHNSKAELYLLIITEKIFMEMPNLKRGIIANAQNASGLTKVRASTDEDVILDGNKFGRLIYEVKSEGVDFTFENYYANIEGAGSFQFVFYTASSLYESAAEVISKAAASIKVAD